MKRFAMIVLAVIGLVGGIGVASAQMHSGGSHGGGGSHASGQWHSGGSWNGGNWRGGNWHGGSRVFVGVGFGAPWWGWWPGYYPLYYPYYGTYGYYPYPAYYSYDYAEPSYIQQDDSAYQSRSGQRGDYSYYCPDPAGYYPQVQTCAQGWLRVVPPSAPGPGAPAQR
ncbi:MAG: hypothetical protein E6H64_11715 [Betaproteobacteria bacterium]|nr:MAG: hypothetical protein E6H64_11715 [Betaproteobacteria bacterium]